MIGRAAARTVAERPRPAIPAPTRAAEDAPVATAVRSISGAQYSQCVVVISHAS